MNTPYQRSVVRATPEFHRVARLPRRAWDAATTAQCVAHYTATLRTKSGTQTLKPVQAIALHELVTQGGLLGLIGVGGGKTLISLLASVVLRAETPLLLLPAFLIDKTYRELNALAAHWQVARNLQLFSYDALSREGAAHFLDRKNPDFIFCDEGHRLKNMKAGVTRRVARWMHARPNTKMAVVSGTLLTNDLDDLAHLAAWALKRGSPCPLTPAEWGEWSAALGEAPNPMSITEPGALLTLAAPEDWAADELTTARRAFRRRLRDTPGVVCSGEDEVTCSLYIRPYEYTVNAVTEANFQRLRGAWETPDGWTLSLALDQHRHAKELALGFHSIWSPRPPPEWLDARKAWAKFVRQTLAYSRHLDTEKQVEDAVISGSLDRQVYLAWEAIRYTFRPNPVMVWHDDSAINACRKWLHGGPGIIWTEHVFFAEELARQTGLKYYGENGLDRDGNFIMDAPPNKGLIASRPANATGRNMQAWNRSLVTCPRPSALIIEQLIGRTHRAGQQSDTVIVDYLFGCLEHIQAIEIAIAKAKMTYDTLGQTQKLLTGTTILPTVNGPQIALPRWTGVGDD